MRRVSLCVAACCVGWGVFPSIHAAGAAEIATSQDAIDEVDPTLLGRRVAEFTLKDYRGKPHSLADHAGRKSNEVANACVRAAYLGDEQGNAIHLLGALSGNVLRVSPPLTITLQEADYWMNVLHEIFQKVGAQLASAPTLATTGA